MKIILNIIGAITPLGAWFKIATNGLSPAALLFPVIVSDLIIKSKIRLPTGWSSFWYQTFLFIITISFLVNQSYSNTNQLGNFFFYFIIMVAIDSMNISSKDCVGYYKSYINVLFAICIICLASLLGVFDANLISRIPLFVSENELNVILGSEENPGAFAFHLIMTVPFVAYLVATTNKVERYYYYTVLVVFFGCLFWTFSRGAIIGLLIAGGMAFTIYNRTKYINIKNFLVLILVMSIAWLFYESLIKENSTKVLQNKKTSEEVRVYVLSKSLESILENPIFGIGADRFAVDYIDQEYSSFHRIESSHNSYINIAVAYGIPASVSFLAAAVCLLFNFKNRDNSRNEHQLFNRALWASIAAMLIDGLFHDNYINSGFWTCVGFMLKFSRVSLNAKLKTAHFNFTRT